MAFCLVFASLIALTFLAAEINFIVFRHNVNKKKMKKKIGNLFIFWEGISRRSKSCFIVLFWLLDNFHKIESQNLRKKDERF